MRRGMEKHRYGQAGIHYSADGRIMTGAREATFPRRSQQPHNRDAGSDYRSYDPYREQRRADRDQYRQPEREDPRRYQGGGYDNAGYNQRRNDPSPTRRYDDYDRRNARDTYGRDYRPNGIEKPPLSGAVVGDYDRTGLITDKNYAGEYRKYDRSDMYRLYQPFGIYFVICGMLLILFGIVNIVICSEYHYYSRFWAGVVVLEMGIFGLLHKRDYKTNWKTYSYTFLGFIGTIAALVSIAFILEDLIPQVKMMSVYNNVSKYITAAQLDLKETNSEVDVKARVWVCLGFDCASVIIFIASCYGIPSALATIGTYLNVNYRIEGECEPYCLPRLFNPFVQVPIGELMVLVGIVTRFACEGTDWKDYWSPVWAGGLTVLAACLAMPALKRTEQTTLNAFALFLEAVAFGAAIGAISLCTIGMSDNIKSLQDDNPADGYAKNVLIISVCIFALADMILLFGCFMALGVIIKIVRGLFSSPSGRSISDSYSESSGMTPIPMKEAPPPGGPVGYYGGGGYHGGVHPSGRDYRDYGYRY